MNKICNLLIVSFALSVTSLGAQTYAAWSYTAKLTLNTSVSGANITGTGALTNFPVLVRLDSGVFDFSQTKTGGADIRFSNSSGVTLSYEISRWDGINKLAEIWVKVDVVAENNETQFINIHWGKSDAISESNGASVFSNSYELVWHLEESPNNDVLDAVKDQTGNLNHGTSEKNLGNSNLVQGISGNGFEFNGDGKVVSKSNLSLTAKMPRTISIWAMPTKYPGLKKTQGGFFQTGNSNDAGGAFVLSMKGEQNLEFEGHYRSVPTTQNMELLKWQHLTVSYNGTDVVIYHNGNKVKQQAVELNTNVDKGQLGWTGWQGTIKGVLDEFHISTAFRSDNWIKLLFENQKSDQSLVSLPIPSVCTEDFGTDVQSLTVGEWEEFKVLGRAKCASRGLWYKVEGGQEIFTGFSGSTIGWRTGRLLADSAVTLRWKALYGTGWRSQDVILSLTNSIPEPDFTLSFPIAGDWNGKDTISLKPAISNLTSIQAQSSPANVVNYTWKTWGIMSSKNPTNGELFLREGYTNGALNVELCLENGGPSVCKLAAINTNVTNDTPPNITCPN